MSEPQLERLFSRLGNAAFAPGRLAEDADLLDDILWYCCDRGRAENAVRQLGGKPQNEQKIIIANLGSLYPLTGPILARILREITYADEYLCLGMDPGQNFLTLLKGIIAEMGKEKRLTTRTLDYGKEVERLRNEAAKLQPLIDEKKLKEEELANLRAQADLRQLKREIENLDRAIRECHDKKESLEKKIAEGKKRRDELAAREKKLLAELAAMREGADPQRLALLRQLFESFAPDAEDD